MEQFKHENKNILIIGFYEYMRKKKLEEIKKKYNCIIKDKL